MYKLLRIIAHETERIMSMWREPDNIIMRFIRNAVIVIVSAFFGSSVQIFVMIPNGMTSGGMPGIARLITHFLPISY